MHKSILPGLILLLASTSIPALADQNLEVLQVKLSEDWGPFLADGDGRALYTYANDIQGKGPADARSTCTSSCTTAWPPASVRQTLQAGPDVRPDLVGSIRRSDGSRQLTYNGWPLYYWVADRGKGGATGQNVKSSGGKWHLIGADGSMITERRSAFAGVPGASTGNSTFADLEFKGPECVRYDSERDRYLVSNINGGMLDVDGNGYVSAVKPDGSVAEAKWIDGAAPGITLNAPKGMQIAGEELHVADIDFLRTFDADSGKPLRSLRIEGANFLNDLAIAKDGTIYVTDSGTKDLPGAIYKITPDQKVTKIAGGHDLHRPNGLDFDLNGDLITVTFAGDEVIVLSTEGRIKDRQKLDAGKLDGLIVGQDGTRFVSSWKGKHVVRIDADGAVHIVLTDIRTPAAFEIDVKRNRLLIPAVKENAVVVAPIL